jgi:hypothetical protein
MVFQSDKFRELARRRKAREDWDTILAEVFGYSIPTNKTASHRMSDEELHLMSEYIKRDSEKREKTLDNMIRKQFDYLPPDHLKVDKYILERPQPRMVYEGPQFWINRQIEKHATPEEKKAIEYIKNYASLIIDANHKILVDGHKLPPSSPRPNLDNTSSHHPKKEDYSSDYLCMKEFLEKNHQYRTRAAQKIRLWYGLK